jgi:hypothetical protein
VFPYLTLLRTEDKSTEEALMICLNPVHKFPPIELLGSGKSSRVRKIREEDEKRISLLVYLRHGI